MHILSGLKFALALGGLSLAMSTSAAPVTLSFTGSVTANNTSVLTFNPSAVLSPAIGSTFNGSFTVDDSNTSGVGGNCVAISNCWSDNSTSWSWDGLNVGASGAPGSAFRVFFDIIDSVAGLGQDELTITLKGDINLVGELSFIDSTGSAFESAGSSLLPSFTSFDSGTYTFQPTCFGGALACAFSLYHSGDIVNPAVVPIPAAAWLFGSALLGLGALKRKKA